MGTKITKFDPATLEMLRPKIVAALATLDDLGLAFVVGRMTFLEHQFSTKLTVTLSSVDIPREEYKKHCGVYGLKAEWLDQTVTDTDGVVLTVVGLDSSKRTKPVVLKTEDGEKHSASVTFIKTNLMPAKELLAEGKKFWNETMKAKEYWTTGSGKGHNNNPMYRLKDEWLGQPLSTSKYTIAGLINSEPTSVLVREGALNGDGRFGTFPVTNVLLGMDPESAAGYEYEIRCVQDEWDADGLRKEWLGKDFVFTWPGWSSAPFRLLGLDGKQKSLVFKCGDKLQVIPLKDKQVRAAMQKQHPVASALARAKGAAASKAHKRDRVA